ncbi:MAG TPA: 50S ribosomal protein L6 [Gammaproteobacteria bacterium]|uniref:Large ribosomal subunit protein uL6 n=1 Tax=uncultured gamma proteobacterium Rifle_16ft_4_minimus_1061 TaxID=1665198 RepID=A0A0H4T305_9GAMM|nr:50S ribosomal protein L6, large subunit ribosomal protein L6 [uncultured gamma proteobacterium Rifle_16ft_4_minimus_1061]
MSRIAKRPVQLAKNVSADLSGRMLTIKGPKGSLSMEVNTEVEVSRQGETLAVAARSGSRFANAMSGTTSALIKNMVAGVTNGYQRKLELVGVGFRAQAQGKKLNLTLGFSHPVVYSVPEGITVETPSQTEIIVKGIDRQKVGQVAAELRKFRPPEPYKGKGVRYTDEHIVLKEAKKK